MAVTNTNKHWALQRKLLMNTRTGFNAEVYRHFRDIDDSDTATSQSRKTLRDSLLINNKDSRTTATFKVDYFYQQVLKVQYKPTVVGVTKSELDAAISPKYKPHVILYFYQDAAAVPKSFERVEARISFRLMDESNSTLTKANLLSLARAIKTELASGQGWTFDKGKHVSTYKDLERGYQLQLYTISKAEARQVVQKILSIRNHPFEEKLLQTNTPDRDSENTPPSTIILGETYKEPRWRPTATVRFAYAEAILHNLPEPICLVDRTRTKSNPIERAY